MNNANENALFFSLITCLFLTYYIKESELIKILINNLRISTK